MNNSIYTKPKVCKSKKGWYVYFRYRKKLKRYKLGINYIKNLTEREREANALAKVLHDKLKKGWNPFDDHNVESDNITLISAIDFALSKKKETVVSKTFSGYNGSVKFCKKAILSLGYDYLTITETKRIHIRKVLEKAKKQNNWTNSSYNRHLNHLKAVLSELIDWDIIENNPAHKIKKLPVIKEESNRTPTLFEQNKIKTELKANHPFFYNFIVSIFHTGIRPKELLSVKIYMINLKQKQIKLPGQNTKTGSFRIVPINNHLVEILKNMELNIYPEDFYLFGSYRESGKGNRGKFIDFIPGPTKLKRDTATKRWKKIIKDGLNIDVNMYAMKHLGADAKIIAGIDLDSLRELYGHKSKLMTTTYAKRVKEIYRNEIIEKSPKF